MAGKDVKYGIAMRNFTAFPELPDAQALIEYGVKMEELGFESLWVWDHILLGVERSGELRDLKNIMSKDIEVRVDQNGERHNK